MSLSEKSDYEIKLNKDCKQILIIFAVMLIVSFMPGCSSMQVETEDDKIGALIPTVPKGITVKRKELSYFTGLLEGANGYYCKSTKTIYTIYDACVFEHEIYHAVHGLGHDHFPDRLMRCGA